MPFDRFQAFFEAHPSFLIVSHVDPDGDAIGSSLGLAWALRTAGREVAVVNTSPLPENLRFMPGSEWVRRPAQLKGTFSAVVVLDCSSVDRVGSEAEALIAPGAAIANIDHHAANDGFGDPRLVNTEACATAELVLDVLDACGYPLEPEAAVCLYTGLASDTGGFRYLNTTPRALRMAARLVEHGALPAVASDALYGKKSEASLRVLGLALSSLERLSQGQVAALTISREMFEKAGASSEDSDGIVQFAKALDGTRVGILIQEVAPGEVRLSIRSDGTVDVNAVAARFGGGGHRNASGARVNGNLATVRREVLEALDRAVNGGPPPSRG